MSVCGIDDLSVSHPADVTGFVSSAWEPFDSWR